MGSRPRLKQQFRPLRRGDGRVQLGVDPSLGVVLEGLCDGEVELLERLDGTLDEPGVTAWAAERGIPGERVAALLATLREHRLTVESPAHRLDLAGLPGPLRTSLGPDADALACAYRSDDDGYALLAGRGRRGVLVDGGGTLPSALVQALRQAGVGRVHAGRYAADARPSPPPDLVVLAGTGALDPARATPWMRDATPHLPLVLHGTSAEVGPLVRPGSGPCLRCLDLTRADLDPAWPAVLSQLAPAGIGAPPDATGETSLVLAAAGLAAMVALAALDGQPTPPGISVEVSLARPHVAERRWLAHPACSCGGGPTAAGPAAHLAAAPRGDTAGGPAAPGGHAQATMAG
jgi:bacteriocin biosynthesis cyclodehydratase domain-containing protein